MSARRQKKELTNLRVTLLLAALYPSNVKDCLDQLRCYDKEMVTQCCQQRDWRTFTTKNRILLAARLFFKEEVLQTQRPTVILCFYGIATISVLVTVLLTALVFRLPLVRTMEMALAVFVPQVLVFLMYIALCVRGIHVKLGSVSTHETLLSISRAQHSAVAEDLEASEKLEAFVLLLASSKLDTNWRCSIDEDEEDEEQIRNNQEDEINGGASQRNDLSSDNTDQTQTEMDEITVNFENGDNSFIKCDVQAEHPEGEDESKQTVHQEHDVSEERDLDRLMGNHFNELNPAHQQETGERDEGETKQLMGESFGESNPTLHQDRGEIEEEETKEHMDEGFNENNRTGGSDEGETKQLMGESFGESNQTLQQDRGEIEEEETKEQMEEGFNESNRTGGSDEGETKQHMGENLNESNPTLEHEKGEREEGETKQLMGEVLDQSNPSLQQDRGEIEEDGETKQPASEEADEKTLCPNQEGTDMKPLIRDGLLETRPKSREGSIEQTVAVVLVGLPEEVHSEE